MARKSARVAAKIVVKPAKIKFKTKSGRTVFIKAVKTERKVFSLHTARR